MHNFKLISLLALIFVSCGRIEVPKTEVVEEQGECGEGRICASKEEKQDVETSEEENEKQDVETSEEESELEKYLFVPKSKSWTKHIAETPTGYRMATRSEVIAAIEEGILDDFMDNKTNLWTASEYKGLQEMAWVVSFTGDYTIPKTVAFPTLFIAK